MNWDDFKFFMALTRKTTLKAAAKFLKTDQATVGRRIYSLEEKLGAKLFEKRPQGYFLTEAGERIRHSVEEMEAAIQSIDRQIAGQDVRLEGVIRLALPGALCNHLVIPLLQGFNLQYPKIQLHFLTGPETVNLVRREADLAFRLVRPTQSGLVLMRLGEISLSLYGHQALLRAGEKIKQTADLRAFPFIGLHDSALSAAERSLRKRMEESLQFSYLSAAWSSVFYALSAKAGIGILPHFLAEQNPQLKRIPVAGTEKATLWSVVHPEVKKSARVRALMDYLIPLMRERLGAMK